MRWAARQTATTAASTRTSAACARSCAWINTPTRCPSAICAGWATCWRALRDDVVARPLAFLACVPDVLGRHGGHPGLRHGADGIGGLVPLQLAGRLESRQPYARCRAGRAHAGPGRPGALGARHGRQLLGAEDLC